MSFLLAHLSDAHIGPIPAPSLGELFGKRATGYANWLRKRKAQHDMALLGSLVDDLKAQAPAHVAMTGDIVNIGLPAELALAEAWLRRLGGPEHVSFSPGNHDAYTPGAMPELSRRFAPFTANDDGTVGFPYLRRRGDVALIGLTSGVPTAPFIASGRLGKEQLAKLAALLRQTLAEGLARVVMLHHPPHRGGAKPLRGLQDAGDFEAVIADCGAELVLHGHNHGASLHFMQGPAREVCVVGVASASAKPGGHYPGAAYHLFEIARAGEGWRILWRTRGLAAQGRIEDLGERVL